MNLLVVRLVTRIAFRQANHGPADKPSAGLGNVARSAKALNIAAAPEIAVIGGAEIFALFLDRAGRIELTEVHARPGGDAVVPPFEGWRETAREDHPAENDQPAYSFVTLERP